MLPRVLIQLAVIIALVQAASGQPKPPSENPKRLAIVISNSAYRSLRPIASATQEGDVMADALTKAGFTVRRVKEMTFPEFVTQHEKPFLDSVQPGDVCVVYYAGYAAQGEDDNYLLPVNFQPQGEQQMEERAYHLSRMQQRLEERRAGLKVFILEASRSIEQPIAGSGGPGLMEPRMSDSKETIFSFSAYAGQAAPDHTGIGLFTSAVAEAITQPGSELRQVFEAAKQRVGTQTQSRQVPYVASNVLRPEFYFRLPEKKPEVVVEPTPPKPSGPSAGLAVTNRRDRLEYVLIPAGKFKMGCVPKDDRCKPEERPSHEATISKQFWMGRTEVQASGYRRYVEEHKNLKMPAAPDWNRGWKITDQPMVNLRWEEAKDYCTWIGGRLPTEAEWEYAARAGAEDQIFPLDDQNSRDKANFYGRKGNDKYEYVAPAKSFDPNAFGLYDMAGNVWEWVNDFFAPYPSTAVTDPQGPDSGKEHVGRGGSFDSDPTEHLRISFRRSFGKSGNSLGFRCVMDDTPESQKILTLPSK